jgi:hypothetical protein
MRKRSFAKGFLEATEHLPQGFVGSIDPNCPAICAPIVVISHLTQGGVYGRILHLQLDRC